MLKTVHVLLSLAVVGICSHAAVSQRSQAEITGSGIRIAEPGVYQLSELFKHSDIVARVNIVSGDTEHYDGAVYKAKVLKGFKGASPGQTIYFGRYVGERLGWEYFVFLQNADTLEPKLEPGSPSFGKVRYSRVFNEGYSSMETKYSCIFDGHEVDEKCDHGVRVCTDYIKLPVHTPVFPPVAEDTPFGCRWVRQSVFETLLESIQKSTK
jgi:hypothetical protein